MFREPQAFLICVLVACLLFQSAPREAWRVKSWVLILVSCLLVYSVSPPSLALVILMTLGTRIALLLIGRWPRRWLLWLSTLGLVAALVGARLLELRLGKEHILRKVGLSLGLSYACFKSISVLMDGFNAARRLKEGQTYEGPSFTQLALLNTFFPIYGAGPVEVAQTFAPQALSRPFDGRLCVEGLGRLLLGLGKIFFLAGVLLDPWVRSRFPDLAQDPSQFSALAVHAYIWLNFLSLYLNFSGYTDVAVGVGGLLGLEVTENFKFPFLAKDIQDFWRRWHVSMTNFAFRYMYFPLIQRTRGRVALSIFVTFALIGLWHGLTWNFFLWGVFHGLALAGLGLARKALAKSERHKALKQRRAWSALATLSTVFFVAWTWSFGIAPTLDAGWSLTRRLIGL